MDDVRRGELVRLDALLPDTGAETGERADQPWIARDATGRPYIVDSEAFYANRRAAGAVAADCATCADARLVKRADGELVACPRCGPTVDERARAAGFDPSKTFDTWNADPATQPLRAAVTRVLNGECWCAFLRASFGTGKTHLANAAGVSWIATGGRARFWSMPTLMEALRETQRPGAAFDLSSFLERRVYDAELLVLDDLGSERLTEFVEEQTYRIVNHAYVRRGDVRLIVTSNVAPEDAAAVIDGRVLDRLSPGEVVLVGVASRRPVYDR